MSQSQTPPGSPMVRALFRAVPVTPADGRAQSLSAKVYYPAVYTGSDLENNTGSLPMAPVPGRCPLAILMPGINVSPEAYAWLAIELARAGIVCLTYGWVLEEMPGMMALSPGLDIEALKPSVYGQRPSATALAAVIDELARLNEAGPLAGRLDLDRILLGGHSAGGSVALFNARPDWFPGLRAVFAYGAHSKASTMLGYPADTLLPLPDVLPTLIMGGSEDGVIAASVFRYGDDGQQQPDPVGPLRRSFAEGLGGERGDCHLAILRGANHFSLCWPQDSSTGRPFLDWPETRENPVIRGDVAALVLDFARTWLCDDGRARTRLRGALEDDQRISEAATR